MSISHFFVDRPIFAWVIGLITMLIGLVALSRMSIAQYPSIAPPEVVISVTDPGASAETVNDTVVQPILQQMYGLDHLEYMSAVSYANGSMEIDVTFAQGTNPDIAQVQVQNKLQLAQPRLPPEVVAQGMNVVKAAKNFMLVISFESRDGSMSGPDIADYVASSVSDPISRVSGVGDHTIFGSEYAMRIWMNPDKLNSFGLNVSDVQTALQNQNIQIAAGELGGLPATKTVAFDATIIGPTRLHKVSEFRDIVLKVLPNGSTVKMGDIGRVELGPQNYSLTSANNNVPAAALALKLAPGANQFVTESNVKKELARLSQFFPPSLVTSMPLDTGPFIVASLHEVVETLIIAILLVVGVMLIFLQNLRATLIPAIAVPIVLLGTFAVLFALGYTINTLTMLAMVLAVGLLVDDAIVVVENVERVMTEEKLPPREATKKSMDEITGALFGIVLVLSAVFLPMAAFSGSVGVIYRQFSITIVSAMWLSVLVAVILTPALCATILKPEQGERKPRAAQWFNRHFERLIRFYIWGVDRVLQRRLPALGIFAALAGVTAFLFFRLPTGFLPEEDQAKIYGMVTTPPNAPRSVTHEINAAITDWTLKTFPHEVRAVFTMDGYSFAGQGQNSGAFFINLMPWEDRPKASQSAAAIATAIMKHFYFDPRAQVFAFSPPAVVELGNATGFDMELVNVGGLSHQDFLAARNRVLAKAAQEPAVTAVRPMGMEDAAQYHLHVDRQKAEAMSLSLSEINTTIEGALGSIYVNQFLRGSRVKQVYIQGEPNSRMNETELKRWYVRNQLNEMVPLSAFTYGEWVKGAQKVENYNGLPAFEIQGSPGEGHSSGQAMAAMKKIVESLPGKGVTLAWTNLSFEQAAASGSSGPLYGLAVIVIVLCLAALYESWSIPFAVILVVPLGVLGAIVATLVRHYANDVYFQVGMLTTVGLSIKNAILIVEFAQGFFNDGMDLQKAVLQAARERLRPILMTSIAFFCGVVPLAIASGAGAAARRAIGTCVVGGMLSATLLAVYFVPLFFVAVLTFFKVRPQKVGESPDEEETGHGEAPKGAPA